MPQVAAKAQAKSRRLGQVRAGRRRLRHTLGCRERVEQEPRPAWPLPGAPAPAQRRAPSPAARPPVRVRSSSLGWGCRRGAESHVRPGLMRNWNSAEGRRPRRHAQGLWKIHPTLPLTQIQCLQGSGGGDTNDNNTEISSAGTALKNVESFQSTFMSLVFLESHKNLLKNYLLFLNGIEIGRNVRPTLGVSYTYK